jgi:serine/threonine protein phosphatase 1
MDSRTIVIGDVHGCFVELMVLLSEIGLDPHDRLIFVGDLIAKGPANRAVLDFVRQRSYSESVMGNYEHLLLRHYRGEAVELEPAHVKTIAELGADFGDYMDWVARLPFYIDLGDYLVVHAGIRPGRPLELQTIDDLTQLRALDGPEPGSRDGTAWFEHYRDKKKLSSATGFSMLR